MLRSFGKIGPQIDQIWAWLSRGHRWAPGVRNPFKISVTGPSLLVNCYLKIKFRKIIRVKPPPPPRPHLTKDKPFFICFSVYRDPHHHTPKYLNFWSGTCGATLFFGTKKSEIANKAHSSSISP